VTAAEAVVHAFAEGARIGLAGMRERLRELGGRLEVPPGSIREAEEFRVELPGVTVLELIVKPNISGGDARASLRNFRLS
jgi:hypothetical protein